MNGRLLRRAAPTLVLMGLTVLAGARPVAAQGNPIDAIRSRNQTVQAILETVQGDSVFGETRERLKDEINSLIDFPELSERALGRYWGQRTPEEQAEFVDVFRELVRNSSVKKLGVHEADSVVYNPARIEGETATVTTQAFKDDRSVEIVYLMLVSDGEWKAWDVVIDGSSTMRTYRDSFNREIRSSSFQAMLGRLKDRLEEERSGT